MAEDTKKNSAGEDQPVNKKSQYQSPNGGHAYDSKDDFSTLATRVKKAQKKIELSPQEHAVLRAEVIRKNAAQKGKTKSVNTAFTANCFYVYSTTGDDDFQPIAKFDVEKDRDKINYWLTYLGE